MNGVFGLVNLHNCQNLGELTDNRPVASTTFLGRFTFIDFALTNFTNSGIDQIGILVKDQARSILKHLGGKSVYLKNTKRGYQNIFINEKGFKNEQFNTDVHNIKQNDWFMFEKYFKYVVISGVNCVMKINYEDAIKEHIKSGREISVIYADVKDGDNKSYFESNELVIDSIGDVQKVSDFECKHKKANISTESFIFNIETLKQIIENSDQISELYSLEDLLKYGIKNGRKVHAIKYDGYFRRFASLEDYFNNSREFFDDKVIKLLRDPEWPIYTRAHDTRPSFYGEKCDVQSTILANGCIINGKVKNSIISRRVTIEEGAIVEDSIIFTNTVIKSGVHVKNCVIDKHCCLENKKLVSGTKEKPLYIHQGAKL